MRGSHQMGRVVAGRMACGGRHKRRKERRKTKKNLRVKGEDREQLGKKNPREKEEDFWGKRALENFGQQLGAGRSGKREVFFFLGEEAKAGEQTFRFGYYVFPCIFYFFHISHVSFSMISTPFVGLLHLVIIGFIFEELELILYYILVSIFPC